MSDNDVSQIKDRLTRLETLMDEKWSNHDKRADERWTDLMEKFHEVTKKLDNRQCITHSELMLNLDHRIKSVERWQSGVNWAVGIIYVAVIGAIVKHFLS